MDSQHSIQDVKTLRQDIDALVQRLDAAFSGSRELALVKTKLEEAKMWAGKELGNYIGQSLPAGFADKAVTQAGQIASTAEQTAVADVEADAKSVIDTTSTEGVASPTVPLVGGSDGATGSETTSASN
jgi:hypothetical protein